MSDLLTAPAPAAPTQPTAPAPTAPTPTPPSSPELEFLKSRGEDVSGLYAELETVLSRRDPEPVAPAPRQPLTGNERLPIREDGTLIETPEAERTGEASTQPQPTPPAKTAQEQALDPYAPEGATPQPTAEPGEVVIDSEGKIRDAKTGRYVPHQAMEAERVRRKAAEAESRELSTQVTKAQERLNVLQELLLGHEQQKKDTATPAPAAPTAPEPEIDPEVDIFGWAKQQQTKISNALRAAEQVKEQSEKQFGELNLQNRYRQDIIAFSQKQPDFGESYNFMRNMRVNELKALGFTDDRQIAAQITAEERVLVQNTFAAGVSAAERFYALARAKGYAPKAADPAPQPAAPTATPAPVQQPSAPTIPQPNAEAAAQIQRTQQGMQASATLSGAGGAPGEGLTVQQLADMPEDKFAELAAKLGKKKLDSLLGGF